MKILYISNSRIPTEKAHAIQIMKMCEAFSDEKINLELVLPTRKNKEFKNTNPFEYYGVKQNFKIKKLFCFDPRLLLKLPQGIYIKFQASFFIISLFFYLLFKKNREECVFFTREEYLLPILQLFSKKIIWEGHNLPTRKKSYLRYWKRCHKIISITNNLKQDLISLDLDENKILVASDGVDINKFNILNSQQETRQKIGLPLDKKIILYTGHFYKWKGVQTLADVAKRLPNYLFVFVGGQDHKFREFKKQNSLNNIIFTGYKNHSEVPFYLKSADVLVLPNSAQDKKSSYTSPLKLFEYMTSSTPIVASNLDNFKEILNTKNAIFFKPDNAEDLTSKIKKIITNSDLAQQISNQALKDVQKYSWQKRVDKIINFIK